MTLEEAKNAIGEYQQMLSDAQLQLVLARVRIRTLEAAAPTEEAV